MKARPVLLVGILLVPACAPFRSRLKLGQTHEGEVVGAEGSVLPDPNDPVGTRKKALVEAQRAAVEKVVGVYLSARTRVEKAILVDQNILARTEGYIKKYDILSEKQEGGFFKTRIRALVAFGQIGKDLDQLGLLKSPAVGNPRVALQLTETIDDRPADGQWAQGAFSQELLSAGYKVVDRGTDADVVISGEVRSQPFQTQGLGGFESYRASLSLKAVKAGSGDVVMAVAREASGLGGSSLLAGQKSLETVGRLAGQELSQQLAGELSRRSGFRVLVDGVPDLSALEDFEKSLQAIAGVDDLFLRSFTGGAAQIDCRTKGDVSSQDVAGRLASGGKVEVQTVSHDSMNLRWRAH